MVISTLRIVPSRNRLPEVLEILRSVLGPIRIQGGCLGCHLYEEDGGERAAVFCSEWLTEDASEDHVRSEVYRRLLAASELSERPPEFRFHLITQTRGLEWIHKLRDQPKQEVSH